MTTERRLSALQKRIRVLPNFR